MTDSERQQILKMIADGKISAEEGLKLMQALDGEPDPEDDESLPLMIEAEAPGHSSIDSDFSAADEPDMHKTDPEFDRKLNRFRSLWIIPLWLGVAITVAGAYWMYSALQSAAGMGFWFYFSWLPFLLGVMITAAAFSSRTSRWIYVNVKQKPGETPQRIVFAFPLSLVGWGINLARRNIPARERGAMEEVMHAVIDSTRSDEPLMVDVNEDGEHVQVYIG
jgi:hypothetical protein